MEVYRARYALRAVKNIGAAVAIDRTAEPLALGSGTPSAVWASPASTAELCSFARSSPTCSSILLQLFLYDSTKDRFKGFLLTFDELAERVVDHRLVATAARFVHLLPKPRKQIVVQANCNPRFPWCRRHYRTTSTNGKVVSLSHITSRFHIGHALDGVCTNVHTCKRLARTG